MSAGQMTPIRPTTGRGRMPADAAAVTVGVFDTLEEAERAAAILRVHGYGAGDLSIVENARLSSTGVLGRLRARLDSTRLSRLVLVWHGDPVEVERMREVLAEEYALSA
ncbi:MAG: hypothetical protein ACR2MA_03230 [Egibacteraceae bacterium]